MLLWQDTCVTLLIIALEPLKIPIRVVLLTCGFDQDLLVANAINSSCKQPSEDSFEYLQHQVNLNQSLMHCCELSCARHL